MQTNKCPICRTKVTGFMQIKVEEKAKNNEPNAAALK
jgi:hypothetical protein